MDPVIVAEHSPKHHIPVFDKNLEAFLDTLDQPAWLYDGIRCKYLWINSAGLKPFGKKNKEEFINTDLSDQSEATRRTCSNLTHLLLEERSTDRPWTMYPTGCEPYSVMIRISGINYNGELVMLAHVIESKTKTLSNIAIISQEALKYSPAMISVIGMDGDLVLQNIAAERFYFDNYSACVGKQSSEHILKTLLRSNDGCTERFTQMQETLERGEAFQEQVQVEPFKKENECWHDIRISKQKHAILGTEVYLVNQADVSELKKKEKKVLELEKSKREAQKDRLVQAVGHELKTPLVGVIGLSESLLENRSLKQLVETNLQGNPSLDGVFESIKMIEASGHRLLELVDRLLETSQMKDPEMELERSNVDYTQMIEQISNQYRNKNPKISLEIENSNDLPIISADKKGLESVLNILLSNAYKFMYSGVARIQVQGTGAYITTAISDEGIGIDEKDFDRIFELFEQADNSDVRLYPGAGVGLSLAKQIIEKHGGSIAVDSEKGVGSTFMFSIPCRSPQPHR